MTSGRCPRDEQHGHGPSHHPATARAGQTKEINIDIMGCGISLVVILSMKIVKQYGITVEGYITSGRMTKSKYNWIEIVWPGSNDTHKCASNSAATRRSQ